MSEDSFIYECVVRDEPCDPRCPARRRTKFWAKERMLQSKTMRAPVPTQEEVSDHLRQEVFPQDSLEDFGRACPRSPRHKQPR